jgi:hypothetical protein
MNAETARVRAVGVCEAAIANQHTGFDDQQGVLSLPPTQGPPEEPLGWPAECCDRSVDGENLAIGEVVGAVLDDVAEMPLLKGGIAPRFLLDSLAVTLTRSWGHGRRIRHALCSIRRKNRWAGRTSVLRSRR